jgi:hypothetical protein
VTTEPERDDSLVFWLFALVAVFAAGFLAYRMAEHHMPVELIVFAGFTSWTGLYMGLGHLWAAAQRARKAGGQRD